MPRLQHLDVSQEPTGMTFGQPRFLTNVITPQMLSKLAESTPTLRSLDISRHNLGSWDEELADESDPNVYVQSSIPGLKRLRRPLDFIGMWMTRWIDGVPPNEDQRRQRSKHTHVPAEKVAGGLTKDTLLVALEVYTERRRRFLKVLTIYHRHHRLLESEEVMVRVAKSIFRAMSYHSVDTDLHVQCIDMLCSIITKYSEDGLKFPKGKLHQQMIRAVLRSAARPQCGQSFVDSVCDAFSILEMWESDLEFIPFVKILFRFVTENIIYDMPDLFDLLVMTINTADADKIAQLIDNDVVQLTMTLINMVIRHGETENPNDPYTDPDDTLEPLNVGWHILKKVTAFGNSRGQFLFGGGVPMIKFCINHMLHCNELLGQSKAHRPPYTCLAEELHMPDVCWCEGFDVSVQQNTKMMTSVAGVICNLVLDAECQPFFEDLVLHLYISLTRTNMMPSNTAVAFCILALERPNLWEDESARLSMFDQVVGSRGLRKDVATDVGKLREALMNKDISALITEKAP
ncbi:uncharacterized protein [Ptychodera flava]|uniref:uncharacterized protein n=1 Tax=Ptychodera flava TaxID=63121 RepID=UPI00396A2390